MANQSSFFRRSVARRICSWTDEPSSRSIFRRKSLKLFRSSPILVIAGKVFSLAPPPVGDYLYLVANQCVEII
jgi:hypothetical protein